MAWLLVAGVVLAFVLRGARGGRRRASPFEPISTLHATRSSRQTARERAALKAATSALR